MGDALGSPQVSLRSLTDVQVETCRDNGVYTGV